MGRKRVGIFCELEILYNGKISIYTCQWNSSYCTERINVEIPTDPINPNITKTLVVSVQDQSHTVFGTTATTRSSGYC